MNPTPAEAVARSGNLVRLAGLPFWVPADALAPCRCCGGRLFAAAKSPEGWRLYCLECVRQPKDSRLVAVLEFPTR